MSEHPEAIEVERIHRELLQRWRGAMNLVGPGSVGIHFEDSRVVARKLDARGRWADLGSGAGFPGVAVAAWNPHAQVSLVESREKRATFLLRVLRKTGLPNAELVHARAESLEPGAWDGLVSRAFANPEAVLDHARRLLKPGGQLALMLAREPEPPPEDFERLLVHAYQAGGKQRWLEVLGYRAVE
jgi:16S rRNA (guanine(527)-N(7))-methyltransferase RsmG